ncbi:hypothetical protein ACRRTK_009684 [Alexandromys fortis]
MSSKMVLTGYQQASKYRIYEVLRRAGRRALFDQPGHNDTESRRGDPPEEVKAYSAPLHCSSASSTPIEQSPSPPPSPPANESQRRLLGNGVAQPTLDSDSEEEFVPNSFLVKSGSASLGVAANGLDNGLASQVIKSLSGLASDPPNPPTPCFPEAPLTSQKLLSAQQEKPWDNAQATSKRTHGDKG